MGFFKNHKAKLPIFLCMMLVSISQGYLYPMVPPMGNMMGQVMDAWSGTPIGGAVINSGNQWSTSQNDGTYYFEGGVWLEKFSVFASGYNDLEFHITLLEGQTIFNDISLNQGISVKAPPTTAIIQGEIYESNTLRRLNNAVIRVEDSTHNFFAISTGNGSFIVKVIPGTYSIHAMLEGYQFNFDIVAVSAGENIYKSIYLTPQYHNSRNLSDGDDYGCFFSCIKSGLPII